MSEIESLEILSDSEDSLVNDPDYVPSTEDSDDSSAESLIDMCWYCSCELEYEDNEFYIEEKDRYCCERCWNEIHEH
jgi:hypothetical protein